MVGNDPCDGNLSEVRFEIEPLRPSNLMAEPGGKAGRKSENESNNSDKIGKLESTIAVISLVDRWKKKFDPNFGTEKSETEINFPKNGQQNGQENAWRKIAWIYAFVPGTGTCQNLGFLIELES